MHKYYFTSLVLALIIGLTFLKADKPESLLEAYSPVPPTEGEGDLLERQKWMDAMHKAAPGVNWREMDQDYRLQRAKAYSLNAGSNYRALTIGGSVDGDWIEKGSANQSGRIRVAELDTVNDILYCSSDGGQIWRTDVGSNQWEVLTDHYRVPAVHMLRIINHNGAQRFIMASSQFATAGVYYSDDTCATWNATTGTNSTNWGYVRRAVVAKDSIQTIYLLTMEWMNGGKNSIVYKSEDHGTSFQQIAIYPESTYGPVNKFDLWTDRYGTGRLFMAIGTNVYEWQQNSFTQLGSFTGTGSRVLLYGYERGTALKLYAMDVLSSSSQLYSSSDNGVTWDAKANVGIKPFMINSFAVSATDSNRVYYGGVDAIRSYNGGQTFSKINTWGAYYSNVADSLHADIPAFCSFIDDDGSEKLYVCTDGGIYDSDDGMISVSNLSLLNLNASQYYSVYTSRVNTNFVHAGAQDQGYQLADAPAAGPLNFDQIWSGDYGHIVSGDNGMSVWMNYPGFTVYYPDILYTTVRKTWQFDFSGHHWIPPMITDPYDHTSVIIGGGGQNGGAHLVQVSYGGQGMAMQPYEFPFDFSMGGNDRISAMAVSPMDDDCWYVLTDDGKFFHSSDAGVNWTLKKDFNQTFGHYLSGSDILPSPNQYGKVYICGSGYSNPGVYVLHDHGATWKAMDTDLPSTLIHAMDCTPDESLIFAATTVGPFVYISAQEKWFDLSEGFAPDQQYWDVEYIESLKTARFASYGRGVWDFTMCNSSKPNPVAGFTWSEGSNNMEVQFVNTSSNSSTWLWLFGDSATSLLENPAHTFTQAGTYQVMLVSGNNCDRDTIKINITLPLIGIDDKMNADNITIFPQPANNLIYINSKKEISEYLSIYNLKGERVFTQRLAIPAKSVELNLSDLPAGVYFLRMRLEDKMLAKKLIIM